MALKDIWQQDRQTRQAEVLERSRTVAELRSQHQAEHAAMATQLRDELSQVLPKLRADELDRQLEAQCDQAAREIEASARRQEVQEFLYELHDRRLLAAADLRLLLEEFRCDRKAQSAEISAMLKETHRQRLADVKALFAQFTLDTVDRKAAVQAIRDYVWGDASSTVTIGSPTIASPTIGIQSIGSESIEDFLKLVIQESSAPNQAKSVTKSVATASAKPQVAPEAPIVKTIEPMLEPIAEPIAPVSTLSEKLLATVNSLSGVRLSDLEATVGVSRSELVQALQQLIRSGDVVQRDRSYYRA
jgi:hypothetical protein